MKAPRKTLVSPVAAAGFAAPGAAVRAGTVITPYSERGAREARRIVG